MTDHRLLTPDELAAIRDYITGWEPARDRRFLEAARTLLDHADAQDAELARLRDALAALVDAEAHGTPGGYIGVDPSGETHDRHCTYCYTSWQLGEPERHDTDCPIASARRVLDGSA